MARPLRIQYPGAVYHLSCRGNERREIFRQEEDRHAFLRCLYRSLNIYSIQLYAYILMDNHFHLLVETPLGNLSEFMRHFNITYTGYFNRRHKRVGHLYQGRYKSILVDKAAYLSVLSRYIHLNPIRTQLLEKEIPRKKLEYLLQYPWSSLPAYLDKNRRNKMLDCSFVLAEFGGDTIEGRVAYGQQLLTDIDEKLEIHHHVLSQSLLGTKDFLGWVQETFLAGEPTKERPAAGTIKRYRQKEKILAVISEGSGKDLETIKKEKGNLRRLTMDLLFRYGGLRGPEIGELFEVGYSTVSQERRRLREIMKKDRMLNDLVRKLEKSMSTMKT